MKLFTIKGSGRPLEDRMIYWGDPEKETIVGDMKVKELPFAGVLSMLKNPLKTTYVSIQHRPTSVVDLKAIVQAAHSGEEIEHLEVPNLWSGKALKQLADLASLAVTVASRQPNLYFDPEHVIDAEGKSRSVLLIEYRNV